MTIGKLVVVTGPAAVGKSTIGRRLQSELVRNGELCLAVELDIFARALSRDWISMGDHRGRYAERGFVYSRAGDGSIELTLGADGRRVLAAFHRSVAAIVKSGVSVVCETILYDDEDWSDWSSALTGISACCVKLSAPVAILEGREQADRSRAFQGLARGMSARRPVGKYDVEADTAADSASGIVQRIIHSLHPM
ncbi:MAG TPA: hypothetical protein VKF60_19010 [Myxococcota bacterium]|nr:hypothetical protein [Myxococcota bacterium]